MNDNHWAWIRNSFLEWTGGWGDCKTWVVVHGHTPATMQMTGLKALTKAADRVATHGRLCLDAGSTLNLAQVAWAEFAVDQYRFCMTREE